MSTALASLTSLPRVTLAPHPTPIDTLVRLRSALGASCPSLYMKRDDLLSFGMGGNKVRKLQTVLAEAIAAGADTLITCGGCNQITAGPPPPLARLSACALSSS